MVKLPLTLVIAAGLVVTGTALYLMVMSVLALKPVPRTVTVVSEVPLVGVMVIFSAIVKGVVAELALASRQVDFKNVFTVDNHKHTKE